MSEKRLSKSDAKAGRCDGCEHMYPVIATGGWEFFGCRHEPYKGKWVGEIEVCPIGRTGEEVKP